MAERTGASERPRGVGWRIWLLWVLASVVGAFYYLRIVKLMYFDEPATSFEKLEDRPMALVMGLAAVVNSPISFLLIYPLWLAAGTAAAALMP